MSTDISTVKGVFLFDQSKQIIYGNFTESINEYVRNLNDFRTGVMNRILAVGATEQQGF